MKRELARRSSHVSQLRAFFFAHVGDWLNAQELEAPAGRQAWRTRVSELRRDLERMGHGTIENRVSRHDHGVISEYRLLLHRPLGPSADSLRPSVGSDGPFARGQLRLL